MRTLRDVARARLRAQRLVGRPLDAPADVVRWMGAVQSQERAISRWSVAQRMADPDPDTVDRALAEGSIVRTHVLRPTWHYVAADDLRWMVELTAPRVHQLNKHYYGEVGIDEALVRRSRRALEGALRDGGALTRAELAERLRRARVGADVRQLGYLLMRAELDLLICGGPPRGKHHSYALVDARAPHARALPRDQALAELATRYFQSHGPATLKDFTWWSSLTMADARRAVEAARLERVTVRERDYWSAGEPPPARPRAPSAHLIQGYDESVVAYRDSRDVYGGPTSLASFTAGPRGFLHSALVGERMAGLWRASASTRRLGIEMRLVTKLSARERKALGAAAERYGRFVGKEITLAYVR